ncbi:uncharacterized protein LOC132726321 [Ruditapes philippinarum]|uniref:uncharacterized protein LOC132726321 n=1 Tax=Ruditapes philippinarum TaxID=129788 RepID=UPI00295B11A4|nr:uncharacterized protein LOC132726321 [Ruditapes philippinarum]
MQDAFNYLQEVVNESKAYIGEIDKAKRQIQEFSSINVTAENMTSDSFGISSEYAAVDYNMTQNDIYKAINDTKKAASEDPLLTEIQIAVGGMNKAVDDEIVSLEKIDFRNTWFTSLINMTKDYFNNSECENFQDCIFYSISNLYVLYESENFPNISSIQDSIVDLENLLIEIFQNESFSVIDTSVAYENALFHINKLVSMNLFCSDAPKFVKQLQNQTVLYGSNVTFFCNAAGDPELDFIWLVNDTIIPGESSNVLTVLNVTENDSYEKYNCMAGNIVANITSSDAYISIKKQVLPASANPCDLGEQLTLQCDNDSDCQVVGNKPTCRQIHEENIKEEDYLIIVGLVLGVAAVLVTVILLIVCVLQKTNCRKKLWPHKGNSSRESGEHIALPYLSWRNLLRMTPHIQKANGSHAEQ